MELHNKQKLIFLDLDGTIYNMIGIIPDSTIMAIEMAKSKGHKIFLNTGRSRAEVPEGILRLEFDGIITSGGACIEIAGKQIMNRYIDPALLKEIYQYLLDNEISFVVETNELIYGTKEHIECQKKIYMDNLQKSNDRLQNIVMKSQAGTMYKVIKEGIEQFTKLLTVVEDIKKVKDVNKITFSNSKIPVEQMKRDFGEWFIIYPGKIDSMKKVSGEMYNHLYNKATGIDEILNYYNAKQEDSVAFGDSFNDIEAIYHAGIGIAMGNAAHEVMSAADFVTKENYNDGLYYGFAHYGLI